MQLFKLHIKQISRKKDVLTQEEWVCVRSNGRKSDQRVNGRVNVGDYKGIGDN